MEYDRLLAGRSAVVTGAAGPIGRAVARCFARQGARVAVLDENAQGVQEILDELTAIHPACCGFAGCLTEPRSIARLCADAVCSLGQVDLLVNAYGTYVAGDAQTLDESDLLDMLERNVLCTLRCTKALVPSMCESRRGDIINITADLAFSSLPGTAGIAACAGAVAAFTRSVAMDYIKFHVRANCITHPLDGLDGRRPLTGPPDADDVAHAALWYACDMSRFIVGDLLPVNGGMAYFSTEAGCSI